VPLSVESFGRLGAPALSLLRSLAICNTVHPAPRAAGRTPIRSFAQPSTEVVSACFAPRVWILGVWFCFALRCVALLCAVYVRMRLVLFLAGRPFLLSLSVNIDCLPSLFVNIDLQRETEEKARQPETKLSAIAQTRHTARLRDAKRSRTRNPKPTHGARDRPKQPQPRAGRARASEPGRRHSSRRTRPTDTGTRLFVNIDCYREGRETRLAVWAPKGEEQRPNVNERDAHETHPHETGTRHTHTGQPRRPPNRQPQTTAGCWRICQYRFTERRKKRPASRKQN
jgi:hypothetical protein